MGKQKAPTPPDPKETAAAQTGTNIGTAVANARLNNINQITPDGTLNYAESGNYRWKDPSTGKTYTIPTFTATQTLSPQQAAIKRQTDAAETNLAGLANQQSGRLKDLLASPVDLTNEAVEGRLMELGRARLDPVLEQRRDQLNTRLVNQGIRPGSRAYEAEMRMLNEGENDAYNSLLLGGRGQAVQETLTARNQPINEITALLSGSQVSMPQFAGWTGSGIPTTDYGGMVNQNYQQRLQGAQMQNANTQSLLGGLFGLGAAGLGGWLGRPVR